MENTLERHCFNKFKTDIVANKEHCAKYVNKAAVSPSDIYYTIHMVSIWLVQMVEYLKYWYDNKQTIFHDYSYVQILNSFICERYFLKISEACSRVEECLRLNCTRVSKQFTGLKGRQRVNLLAKVKSIAILQGECSTIGSLSQLSELQIMCHDLKVPTLRYLVKTRR